MKWAAAAVAAIILCCTATGSRAEGPPLNDPALLNIGLSCRWDMHCMTAQRKAMKRGLGFVRKARPPAWRVQLCNRNAGRGYQRVDWVGFDHCIRNSALRPSPAPVRSRSRPQLRPKPRHVRARAARRRH